LLIVGIPCGPEDEDEFLFLTDIREQQAKLGVLSLQLQRIVVRNSCGVTTGRGDIAASSLNYWHSEGPQWMKICASHGETLGRLPTFQASGFMV
jgi:hypothetical protein